MPLGRGGGAAGPSRLLDLARGSWAGMALYLALIAVLHAAMNPAKTDALYFVAKGDGSSHFSSNLSEHNQAVNKYQR